MPIGLARSTEGPSNVAGMLWRAAQRARDMPAVIGREGTTVYGALQERAAAIAAALVRAGVQPGDRVGVCLDPGVDAVAAFFAIAAVGGIAVVINESLRPRQIEQLLGQAGARELLTSRDFLARQPRPLETKASLRFVDDIPVADRFTPRELVGREPVQIVYTSGSTGAPKGVSVAHANLWAVTDAVTHYLGISATDRIASVLPFSFVYGMNQVLCAVGTGATLVIERSPLPQELALHLRAADVTVLGAIPPLWHQLLGAPAFRDAPWPALRVVTNAGGHLPVPTVRALRAAQPQAQVFLMYGLTEVLRSTYLPPAEVDRRPDSIGRAIPGAEVMVLRDDGSPCAPGEIGELVHRGPTVTLGYWNDPVSTARVFRGNPTRPATTQDDERVVFSGDMVRRDELGFLYFVGRRDGLIKTLGYRVGPDEVADVLQASGEIAECVITSEPDPQRGARIVAYVVLAEHGSAKRLERYCAAELPRFMQPARYEVRRTLPRLASGKYDLAALAAANASPA